MMIKTQLIALYTIIRRELARMIRISSQTFLPPVITTALYFLVFGDILGHRIGPIENHSYATFIAPGLIALGLINNSYSNVTSSLFTMRFQRSIEELVISPMHWSTMLLGYISGGIIRGLIVALLIMLTASFFISSSITLYSLSSILTLTLIAAIFSLAGFMNGMVAKTFDDIALVPTFILTPLIYLGGVFYKVSMLAPFWQKVILFNPIYYMVHALRYIMLNQTDGSITSDLLVMTMLFISLLIANTLCITRGTGLKE